MAVACFASIAILAGNMAVVYGLDWYKSSQRMPISSGLSISW